MNTFPHLWQYLVTFFLLWGMFQIQLVEKSNTHVLCSVAFFRKSCRLWDKAENVEKPEEPQMTSQYGAYVLHAGWGRLHASKNAHANTQSPRHPHPSTLAPHVTSYSYVHCLSCCLYVQLEASTVLRVGGGQRRVRFPAVAKNVFLQNVQIHSKTHPVSYSTGTVGSLAGGKAVGTWTSHSPPRILSYAFKTCKGTLSRVNGIATRDLWLPPRLQWILTSSGLLRGVRWLKPDVSGYLCPILKCLGLPDPWRFDR